MNCNEKALVRAYGELGKKARVPALWLYSIDDRYLWPDLVERMFLAYADAGAPVRLELVGSLWFSFDGHRLSRLGGRELWRPRIDSFLNLIGAPNWGSDPGDAAIVRRPPPNSLSLYDRGRTHWLRYLGEAMHKAFAVGTDIRFGWAAARDTADEAVEAALRHCEAKGDQCRVVSTDGDMVP